LLYSIDLDSYYEKKIDERQIKEKFNLEIFELLDKTEIINKTELLNLLTYKRNYK